MEKADRLAYARRAYDRNIRMLVAALKRTGLYRVRVNCVGEVLEVQRARSARDGGLCGRDTFTVRVRVGKPPMFGHFNNLDATQTDVCTHIKSDILRIAASEENAHVIRAKQQKLSEEVAGGAADSAQARKLKNELVVRLAMAGEQDPKRVPTRLENLRTRFGELPPSQTRLAEEQAVAAAEAEEAARAERASVIEEAYAAASFEEVVEQEKRQRDKRREKRLRRRRKKAAAKREAKRQQAAGGDDPPPD